MISIFIQTQFWFTIIVSYSLTFPSGLRKPSYTFHMSSGPAEHTSFPTSNRLMMLLVDSTWAPWLTDDVCDLSLENIVPAVDGADGRLLPRRKSDQPMLPDVRLGFGRNHYRRGPMDWGHAKHAKPVVGRSTATGSAPLKQKRTQALNEAWNTRDGRSDWCIDCWLNGWMDVKIAGWMTEWMNVWMYGWLDEKMDLWVDGWHDRLMDDLKSVWMDGIGGLAVKIIIE